MGSKITADGDYSHEIKRRLLLGRKVMTNLDSIFKSTDITLSTKVHLVKAMVFPVVMYGCESWTIKKAERWRIDAFELWCWRRLESPLDCKEIQPVHPKGDQSWVFIGRTECWSWNSNTLATWREQLIHLKRPWCWERLRAGEEGDNRGWDGWMASQLDGHAFEWPLGVGDGQGDLSCYDSWGRKESNMTDWVTELNWTEEVRI